MLVLWEVYTHVVVHIESMVMSSLRVSLVCRRSLSSDVGCRGKLPVGKLGKDSTQEVL